MGHLWVSFFKLTYLQTNIQFCVKDLHVLFSDYSNIDTCRYVYIHLCI